MKLKTSIIPSEDILDAIHQWSGQFKNRADFIETAVRSYIAHMACKEQSAKDLAVINKRADQLNKEAADVLAYQVIP